MDREANLKSTFMKTTQSFRIHFVLRAYLAKNGKAPLYVSVTVNKEKCLIALKQSIDLNNWDIEKGLPKGNREQVKMLNSYLDEVKLALSNCYKELMQKGRLPAAAAIKKLYLGEADEGYTLKKLIAYHNETSAKELTPGTMKNYHVTQRYLVKFLSEAYKISDIYLRELDYKFVKDFELYLRSHKPKDHQKPLRNNGVMKHIIQLKKMVNLARNLAWIDKDPFGSYKLKMQKVNREQLSEAELEAVESKKLTIERLDMVRDMFVFSCYTGLAYIDMINLEPENIIAGTDGDRWIRTFREKTSIPVNVPLLPRALNIIDKYKDNARTLSGGKVFPVVSNQKVNSYLKEIADLCGITKNITFHMARHTFATTVTLSNGMPIETVSKILGHTKITTTQIYAKVIEKKLKDDMNALRMKLGN